ncbi:MAG: hypothetical protein ACLGG5_03010 [Thermoleophilia bacterium]
MTEGEGTIIPLCVPEINKGELPEPLSRLQAMSLGSASETKEVFRALIDQFGFGKISAFRYSSISTKLPRYDELQISDADLKSGTLYTGPYEGYSEEELRFVVEEEIVKPHWNRENAQPKFGDRFFDGALLHFGQLDEQFSLPPGTAKKLLADIVTSEYPAAAHETEHTLRFAAYDWDDYEVWRQEHGYS